MLKKFLWRLIEKLFMVISFFGIIWALGVVLSLAVHLYNETTPQIAHGTKYIYLTLLLFLGFAIWQYVEFKKWFAADTKSLTIRITRILMWLAFIPALLSLASGLIGFYSPEWMKPYTGDGPNMSQVGSDSSFLYVLFASLIDAGFVGGVIFAGLTLFLRFGIFTSGLSLCVALHNYFNGMEFDLSALFDIVLETTLSEGWGIALTIGQFLFGAFISYKLGQ